jgi:hypothetical protein
LAAPFIAFALYASLRSDLRIEHILVIGIVLTLASIGPRTKELLLGLYPLGFVFILYDGMRPYQRLGLTATAVHVCDVHALEARLFGWRGATLHDYWLAHHSAVLDALCAIPYATFVLWCIAGAFYLHVKDRPAMRRFMWGFFLLNLLGFATYHLLPAAPPWYFHTRGCVVDLTTKASEGPALMRVDGMLGVPYFHSMYGKASSVFGALPSLHCAYPLLLVLMGWRSFGTGLRVATVGYWVGMVFSAIYLDHHWMLDALLGSAYSVLVFGAFLAWDAYRARPV